jgi:hypothetical protein
VNVASFLSINSIISDSEVKTSFVGHRILASIGDGYSVSGDKDSRELHKVTVREKDGQLFHSRPKKDFAWNRWTDPTISWEARGR